MASITAPQVRSRGQLLLAAATFFAAAVVIHGIDHARRGVDATGRDVFWVGTAAILLEVGVVVWAFQRHRLAPLAAAAGGLSLAAGYVVVHFLPSRSWLSDSLTGDGGSAASQAVASLEILAALALGIAGVLALQARGGLAAATTPDPEQTTLVTALRQPVPALMALGNVVILVVSFVDLAS